MGETRFVWNMFSLKVGRVLLSERRKRHWNREVARRTGFSDQATHQVLKRFAQRGWVQGQTERIPDNLGRSPRVLYTLTEMGAQAMSDALSALQLAST